jgi:hypothetical protein
MNLESYKLNNRNFNVNDVFSNGVTSLEIKRIFELYNKIYISYDFQNEFILHTEEIESFFYSKSDYSVLVINPKQLSFPDKSPNCSQSID